MGSSRRSRREYGMGKSEEYWERRLPPDYMQILSRVVKPPAYSSKKQLYDCLHQPVLLDQGTMSFVLDMDTDKKCYMISAREIDITWVSCPEYWRWVNDPDSRFEKVAELVEVCWLQLVCSFNTWELSPNTTYRAWLVYKLPPESSSGFADQTQKASIYVEKGEPMESTVRLQPREEDELGRPPLAPARSQVPSAREDGWLELCLGEFGIYGQINRVVKISLRETENLNWKSGLIVEGIEVRPKNMLI